MTRLLRILSCFILTLSPLSAALEGELLTDPEIVAIRDWFESQYDIILKYGVTPAIDGVTYYEDLGPADAARTRDFLKLLRHEYQKYPRDLIKAFGGFSICLIKEFNAAQSGTGGVHTPSHTLFYAIGRLDLRHPYPRLLIHHELAHALDRQFTLPESPTDLRAWNGLQPKGHDWGGGGSKYIRLGLTVANADSHPMPGFVSFYSSASPAEDKAEIWAYLCVAEKRTALEGWIKGDPDLDRKVAAIRRWSTAFPIPLGPGFFNTVTNIMPEFSGTDRARPDNPAMGSDLTGVVLLDGKPYAGATVSLGLGTSIAKEAPTMGTPRISPWKTNQVLSTADGTWSIPSPRGRKTPWVFAFVDLNRDGYVGPGDLASDLNSQGITNLSRILHLRRVCQADFSVAYAGAPTLEKPMGTWQPGKGCRCLWFLSRMSWTFPEFSSKQSVLALIDGESLDWDLHYSLRSRNAPSDTGMEGVLPISFRWVSGAPEKSKVEAGELFFRP